MTLSPERSALAPSAGASLRWPAPVYAAAALAAAAAVVAFGGAFPGAWTRWAGGAGVLALAAVLAWHLRALLHEARGQERRYRQLFSRSPSALIIHRTWQIIACNDAAARIVGLPRPEDLVGRDLLSFYDESSRQRARRRLLDLAELEPDESLPLLDLVIVQPDGREVNVAATATRVDLPDGPATESMFLDVTEHRQAQAALQRSEALLAGLFEACPDIISVSEPDTGCYVMVNPRFAEVIGYTAQEAVGRTALELQVLPGQAERERFLDAVRRDGRIANFPMRYRAKGGQIVPMQIAATLFEVGGKSYLLVMSRDVSEHQRILAEYRAIFDNASVGIALVRRGRLRQVNERFERMLGWTPGTLTGHGVRDIWPQGEAFEASRCVVREAMAQRRPLDFEWRMWRRDGMPFWARSRVTVLATAAQTGEDGRDTIWIVEDITKARQAAADLAAAKEQAEAASQAKSAFLANMSHEIRTPLHGVLGLAQLAAVPDVQDHRRDDYLQRLVESARALSAVISDILDLSKIEAGRLQPEALEFDPMEVLQALRDTYAELARAKSLDFEFEVANGLPALVCADPVRLRQILGNFLNNALKFTARGRIGLQVRRACADRWRFEVSDTGPGIDAALHDTLFEPFTQADDSTTRRYGGTGLGLSICRQLARLMGGEVGLRSRPGRGSVFWAELPLREVQPHTQPQALPEPDAQDLRGARVLVVEDNPVNMLIAVSMLERWGVEVVQAHDGRQALEAVEREGGRLDAVLMDVHMPDMSGYEATERIRRRHGAAQLPVIALTAAAMVSEQRRALEAGMNDFLAKPIDLHGLHATLHRWVRART